MYNLSVLGICLWINDYFVCLAAWSWTYFIYKSHCKIVKMNLYILHIQLIHALFGYILLYYADMI